MKKIISLVLSTLLIFSVVFSVPNAISLISNAVSSDNQFKIINNYDDAGVYYKAGQWNYWTRYSDAACTKAIDSALSYPAFANGTFVDNGGKDGSRAFRFNNASHAANGYPVALRIYDSSTPDKSVFVPEKNTSYTLKLKYKVPQQCGWADLYLNMNGMKAKGDGFSGEKLATAVTLLRNTSISTNTWLETEVTFTVGDTDYEGLGLFFATSNSTSVDTQLLIDDVEITKVAPPDKTVNTYDDSGVYYKAGQWNYWTRYSDAACTKAIDSALRYPAFANGTFLDNGGEDGSRAFRFDSVSHAANGYPVALRIYNSTVSDKSVFVPEKNSTYTVRLKYMVPQQCNWADLYLNINGMTTKGDGFAGEKLATAVSLLRNTPLSTNTWLEAEVTFTVGDTDYEGLGLFFATSNSTSVNTALLIDNVTVEKIRDPKPVELLCHSYTEDGKDETVKTTDMTLFDELEIPLVSGKKFDGWYLDKALTKPASGMVGDTKEIWIKWRTTPISIINNYDDPDVYYKVGEWNYWTRFSDASYTLPIDSALSYPCFANGSFPDGAGKDGSRAFRFESASHAANDYPVAVRIYDSNSADKGVFVPQNTTTYKIKLKYNISGQCDWAEMALNISGMVAKSGAFLGEKLTTLATIPISAVKYNTNTWLETEATFTVGDADYESLGLFFTTGNSYSLDEYKLMIDDIEIREVLEARFITFDAESCGKQEVRSFLPGDASVDLPIPVKDGSVFAGWYTDAHCEHPYIVSVMPDKNIKLYAKWENVSQSAESFSTGFEDTDFESGKSPYNTVVAVNDNIVSGGAVCIDSKKDAYNGSKFMRLSRETSAQRLSVFALINSDGGYFEVQAGQRYRLSYAVRGDNERNRLALLVSGQVPSGNINLENAKKICDSECVEHWDHARGEWGEMTAYFIPEVSGKVYLAHYALSMRFTESLNDFDIDNLKIEPITELEATVVRFYNQDGTLRNKTFGKVGDVLLTPEPIAKTGYTFNGWCDKDGNPFVGTVFPENDLDLYTTYTTAEVITNPSTDFSDTVVIDFDQDTQKVSAFYNSNQNCYVDGTYLETNDAANAHSGNNYFKFYRTGNWIQKFYRRMRVYDPNSQGNMLYLDPLSVYKVSFWLRIDNITLGALKVATLDTTAAMNILTQEIVVNMSTQESEDDYGKWIKYDYTLTTGTQLSTLGFVLFGGYLDGGIDDISIEKIKRVTVTYESNGGSAVSPSYAMTYDYIVPPVEPERDGFVFAGWYFDSALANKFNFKKNNITKNMTLYAAWEPAKEQLYKNITSYNIQEETVTEEMPDQHLDNQVTINRNDKAAAISKESAKEGINLPVIIIVTAASIVLLGGIAALVIIILKKRKKRKT